MTDKKVNIENLRNRIKAGGGSNYYDSDDYDGLTISDSDQERLLEFSGQLRLLRTEYSDERHQKLLNHLVVMAEQVGGLAKALENRDAAEDLVRWIHQTYQNEETNRDFRVALRVFGRRVETNGVETDDDGYPKSIKWISSSTSATYDPSPEPANMLRWEEDVQPMLDAMLNTRDAALIALAFDAGPRGGELYDLQVGDITEGEHGMQVTVRGKQGKRTIDIIPSRPFVERWLIDYPFPNEPTAPFWSRLSAPERISYRMFLDVFKDAAKRVGVTKSVTPTNFRKSSAAHLASKGMNQAHLESHHGWVTGSKAAGRYISIFAEDASRELAKVYGKEVAEPKGKDIAPVVCPNERCGRETPRDRELCVFCGQSLKKGAAERAQLVDETLVQAIAQAEGDRATDLMEMRNHVKGDSELLAEVVDQIAPLLEERFE